jgi:hypothetical protein
MISQLHLFKAWQKETYPEETCVVAPVPGTRVQHVRRENTTYDTYDIAIKMRKAVSKYGLQVTQWRY